MKILVFFFIGLPLLGIGQQLSKLGRFSIEYSKGCLPVTVKVKKLDSFGNAPRTYFYSEGLSDTPDTVHTYFTPDTVRIVQLVGVDIPQKTDTLEFIIIEGQNPTFDIIRCSGTDIAVSITDDSYDYFRIFFTASDSVDFRPDDPLPTFTYPTNTASISVRGLYTDAFNSNCGATTQSISWSSGISAPDILSADFSEGCYGSYKITLSLSVAPNTYIHIINQANGDMVYEGLSQEVITLDDVPIENELCLTVNAIDLCTNQTADTSSGCFQLTEQPNVSSGYSSFTGSGTQQRVSLLSFKGYYVVETSSDQSNWKGFSTETSSFLASTTIEYFRITPTDSCGVSGTSFIVHSPRVKIRSKDRVTNLLQLATGAPLNTLDTPIKAELVFHNPDSSLFRGIEIDDFVTIPTDLGSFLHGRLRYEYADSIHILSNTIYTRVETFVFVPGAFSPNGDGLNDQLEIFGNVGSAFKFVIFNKWGEKVYETSSIADSWDGKVNGHHAPLGTYQYKLSFSTPDGQFNTQVGTFVLIK